VDAVIVGDQNLWHEDSPAGAAPSENPFGTESERINGRDDWIRTSDLTHPKRARYQAAPRPDRFRPLFSVSLAFEKGQDSEELFVQIEEEFSVRARGRFGPRGG
jgi:hypothetical protein